MRPTERTLTPQPAPAPVIRPAVRAFSRRELLLTSWGDRVKMSPADQVQFSYSRMILEMHVRNAGGCILAAEGKEAAAAKAEAEGPADAVPRRRRRPKASAAPV